MGQIQVLDDVTANQIAAGEVIERPYSVVKELIENALDAKAAQIDVYIEDGGTQRIVVVDDGVGMAADDAVLCFSRYATSKIRQVEDLHRLHSFGFRGEALASIASVAKVRLLTRQMQNESGNQIRLEGGKIIAVEEMGSPLGTRIEVKNLFFNVPARLKFLKTSRSESALIESVIRVAAMSKPHVGFSLRIDGVVKIDIRQAPKDSTLENARRIERAVVVLGEESRPYLYPFEGKTDLLQINGYVVAPLVTRKDSRGIHLYVNHRAVDDKQLIQAIRVAYRTLLEVGRHPVCALNIEIDPALVDINVHPRKKEVRFSDASRVQSHLIRLLSNFLSTTPWVKKQIERTYVLQKSEPRADFTMRDIAEPKSYVSMIQPPFSLVDDVVSSAAFRVAQSQSKKIVSYPSLDGNLNYADLRVIGQVDKTFLVLEGKNSMIVLDQHAAHERVVFQRLKDQIAGQNINSQPLLFPLQMSVSDEEMMVLLEHGAILMRYGFEVVMFGENQALIKSIPSDFREQSCQEVIRDALHEIMNYGRADTFDDLEDHLCAQIACHSSIRAGQVLQDEEIRALLLLLDKIEYGAHCPHGRPIIRAIPFGEMARWFHRS
jgi:DNA mismatch repair protein MutL